MTDRQQDPAETSAPDEAPRPATTGDGVPASTDATAAPSAEPQPRPAPQYGEFAPEGWSWTPEHGEGPARSHPAEQPAGTVRETAVGTPSTGRVPGVPHNLGAGRSDPPGSRTATGPRSQPPAGTAAQPPTGTAAQPPTGTAAQPHGDTSAQPPAGTSVRPQLGSPEQPAAPEARAAQSHYRGIPQPGAPGARRGDRVVTTVLLVVGAFGALYFAAILQQLPISLELMASIFQVDGFTVPDAVPVLGTVGALLVLGLYALSLILSIHRMRHGKLSFWIPLVAGVIAVILVFAFSAFAFAQTPELLKALSDPAATQKMLQYLENPGAGVSP